MNDRTASPTSPSDPLSARLIERIRADGPISVSDYMACVAEAYYARGDVFGTDGDFITAPEISQTFGELIGLWSAVIWQNMGRPAPFHLVECGPGRGTLMADALRATSRVPGFLESANIHLVERSAALKNMQRDALKNHHAAWHDSFEAIPRGPLILIANEFLDALPVRQYQMTEQGWLERRIDADHAGSFKFTAGPCDQEPAHWPANAKAGDIYEHSPEVQAFIILAARRITEHGGAALFIDYGHKESACGETLQAVKNHKPHDVLADPGEADLTAHVDFELVAKTATSEGASAYGPVEQGTWLSRLGIKLRGAQLAKGKSPDQARDIDAAIRRLTAPDAMGALFKVMAIIHPDLPPPEGF